MSGPGSARWQRRRKRLERLANTLDRSFRIPGTDWRFGLDGIIGLIPGIGDLATGVLSAYLILEAWRMRTRPRIVVCMVWNAGLDMVLGSIPLLGDLFDFVHKANVKNVRLLIAEHDRQDSRRARN